MKRRSLVLLLACVPALASAASSVDLRPGSRITRTDEAYIGVVPKPAPVSGVKADQAAAPASEPVWVVPAGSSFRRILEDWAGRANWQLAWMLPEKDDFNLPAGNTYRGEFQKAVRDFVTSLSTPARIRVKLVPDNEPPMVYVTLEGSQK